MSESVVIISETPIHFINIGDGKDRPCSIEDLENFSISDVKVMSDCKIMFDVERIRWFNPNKTDMGKEE